MATTIKKNKKIVLDEAGLTRKNQWLGYEICMNYVSTILDHEIEINYQKKKLTINKNKTKKN